MRVIHNQGKDPRRERSEQEGLELLLLEIPKIDCNRTNEDPWKDLAFEDEHGSHHDA